MKKNQIRELVRGILGIGKFKGEDLPAAPPPDDTVERLIGRASGEESGVEKDDTPRESCPYATRRAIVESFEEIRKFAQEHELASHVVKALLTFLAEAALNALKGRVSGKVLEIILNGFNFESARDEAYRQGEKEGRNARIRAEHFPESGTLPPDINGTVGNSNRTTIFDYAKGK